MYFFAALGQSRMATVCDENSKTVKCGPAGRIKIRSASYGRTSWSVCSHGWYFNIKPCSAEGVIEKIASLCDNKTECKIEVPMRGISDPCPVLTKYLTLVYTCDGEPLYTDMLESDLSLIRGQGAGGRGQLLPSN